MLNAEFNYSRQRFDDTDQWGDNGSSNWSPQPVTRGSDFIIPVTNPGHARALALQPSFAMGAMGTLYQVGETLPFQGELSAFNKNDVFRAAFGIEGARIGVPKAELPQSGST